MTPASALRATARQAPGIALAHERGMAETTTPPVQSLGERLQFLAAAEPSPFPVVSLYLNLMPADNGRENYESFVRKAFTDRVKGMPADSPERNSFEQDHERIRHYLSDEVQRSSGGVAIFACAGSNLFEAIEIEAPIEQHWLFVGSVPHLYPLARILDSNPRYAAVLLDTNKAQIFVFGLGTAERAEQVSNPKTRRTSKGGWSQARYQRRTDNAHHHHIKEVVETLDRLVQGEGLQHVVIAGDEGALNLLRAELPKALSDRVIDAATWDRTAAQADILKSSLEALRDKDAETDIEKVDELLNAWRSGGLGVAGPESTLSALQLGQVDELIITAIPDTLKPIQRLPDDAAPGPVIAETSAPEGAAEENRLKLSDELVTRAQQTGAKIRFIENPDLLADIGGVGALLRFRI
jgi:peptide subunit release factor 1 (eRF1)